MSRWIDADALIERWNNMSVRGRTEFDQEIMVAPSIDLVTCLKCKWCAEDDYKLKCWNIKGLNKTDGVVNPDDFCSYGCRKE